MSAKPLEIAEVTALPTKTRARFTGEDGGTASTKRRQGIWQAVGEFAVPRGLIQLCNGVVVRADHLTLMGRLHCGARQGKRVVVSPESSKIVACQERSE